MLRRMLAATVCVLLLAACGKNDTEYVTAVAPETDGTTHPSGTGFGKGIAPQSGDGLLQGVWSLLSGSPLSDRYGANVVWTGRYLFAWGGDTGTRTEAMRGDGAVWDRKTGNWRVLPRAPLSGRVNSAVVWTGRQVIVWGGYDRADRRGFHATADGAAWDPASDRWTKLPASPLRARFGMIATWTGRRLVLLGGRAGFWGEVRYTYTDGASFDPATGSWHKLAAVKSPAGHGIDWRAAVMTDHDVLAWSLWSNGTDHPCITRPGPRPGTVECRPGGGGEMYRYDPDTDHWSLLPQTRQYPTEVAQALWTGHDVIVRGKVWCGCPGPPQPLYTAVYRPATNTWADLPADQYNSDPFNTFSETSAWAGGLFSYSLTGGVSAWNPITNTWRPLPAAPYLCRGAGEEAPAFLDDRVVYWCPHTKTGPAAGHDGLMYTLTPTATPAPNAG